MADWARRGTIVMPEWSPMTVKLVSPGLVNLRVDKKGDARTTSRVVIPYTFVGLNLLAFFRTSATIEMVEFMGSMYIKINRGIKYSARERMDWR
jgi:hypothetical protein